MIEEKIFESYRTVSSTKDLSHSIKSRSYENDIFIFQDPSQTTRLLAEFWSMQMKICVSWNIWGVGEITWGNILR